MLMNYTLVLWLWFVALRSFGQPYGELIENMTDQCRTFVWFSDLHHIVRKHAEINLPGFDRDVNRSFTKKLLSQ